MDAEMIKTMALTEILSKLERIELRLDQMEDTQKQLANTMLAMNNLQGRILERLDKVESDQMHLTRALQITGDLQARILERLNNLEVASLQETWTAHLSVVPSPNSEKPPSPPGSEGRDE